MSPWDSLRNAYNLWISKGHKVIPDSSQGWVVSKRSGHLTEQKQKNKPTQEHTLLQTHDKKHTHKSTPDHTYGVNWMYINTFFHSTLHSHTAIHMGLLWPRAAVGNRPGHSNGGLCLRLCDSIWLPKSVLYQLLCSSVYQLGFLLFF